MSDYRIGTSHDMALENLTAITPQPRSEGVRPARRTYAASGAVVEENLYIELIWDVVGSPTAYQALLTQFGLDSANTAAVTIYVPGPGYTYARFNGTAVRPEVGRDIVRRNYFLRNLTILVRQLEEIAE